MLLQNKKDGIDEVSLAVHREACSAALKQLTQLVAAETSQPGVTSTERLTRSDVLAAAHKRLDLTHERRTRFHSPHEGWRWEELEHSLRAWDQRHLRLNPHPISEGEHPKPAMGLTLSQTGYHVLVRGDAGQINQLDIVQLLELQRALALLFVLRRAMLITSGLRDEHEVDYLLFGNRRARPVLQAIWRALLTHHSELWHADNADNVRGLPKRGLPLHLLPENGPVYLRLPTPFCDLPLRHPATGERIQPLAALGDPRNITNTPVFIARLRQELSTDAIMAALYNPDLPDPAHSVPSPPS